MRLRPVLVVTAAAAVAATAVLLPSAPATAAGASDALLARLTLAQQVGQLLTVGVPATGATAAQLQLVGQYHVGGVILTGRSSRGTALTSGVTAALQARASGPGNAGVPLLVSADQEGGRVQVLSGPGFSAMPTALVQGRESTTVLRQQARTWGGQLRSAGVRLNLAPVADTVPAGANNPPIGNFDRQFGSDPAVVAGHAGAFAAGMEDAGIVPTIKHFPGLGRVTADTDTTAGVTDTVTTSTDAYLSPFATASRTGSPFVMMSTAVYTRIDARNPAAFSPTVIGQVLRRGLGFQGVVISDDLGNAVQVRSVSPGDRALRFISAGGDVVLTVNPSTLPAMYDALYARAAADPAFRTRVSQSALRVLQAKQRLGLLGRASLRGDFTGDGTADRAVFRASTGTWYVRNGATIQYGAPGDVPLAADYDGDGRTDLSVYRPSTSTWYVRGQAAARWGMRGDVPVPADYTGDGRVDRAVYRPSTGAWYVLGLPAVAYGARGDVPVPADYNGDGVADLAAFRPSDGTWHVRGRVPVGFGRSGDVPVPGDWTGDGIADLAVYRPADRNWYVRGVGNTGFGEPTDALIPADYTGDGRLDRAVFRPSTQVWYVVGGNTLRWGAASDRAVLDVNLLRRPV